MITVKLKVNDNKLDEFLKAIESLDNGIIETINYTLPKPKEPKTISKSYIFDSFTPFEDLESRDNSVFYKNNKVKTIQLIAKYKSFNKLINRMGLSVSSAPHIELLSKIIYELETVKDDKIRLKKDKFKPKSEIIEFDNFTSIIVTQNIPLLFDYSIKAKNAKNTYCLLTIIGVEQPKNNEIFNQIMKIIGRKTFNLYKVE